MLSKTGNDRRLLRSPIRSTIKEPLEKSIFPNSLFIQQRSDLYLLEPVLRYTTGTDFLSPFSKWGLSSLRTSSPVFQAAVSFLCPCLTSVCKYNYNYYRIIIVYYDLVKNILNIARASGTVTQSLITETNWEEILCFHQVFCVFLGYLCSYV